MKSAILLFIRIYKKFVSPFLPRACRFYPSCSDYFYQAVEKYGIIKGIKYGLKRILRCNPFHDGGYDPVPDK